MDWYDSFEVLLVQLEKLDSLKNKINYANQYFSWFYSNDNRIIFKINDILFFKLAKNENGVNENEKEIITYYNNGYMVAKDISWIIIESN